VFLGFVCLFIYTSIVFLGIIDLFLFCFLNNVPEIRFCLLLQVKTYSGPIDRASSCLGKDVEGSGVTLQGTLPIFVWTD
jgi:hypothetical protein